MFTALCAGGLSLWKVYLAPYYRQKPAIEELKRMGIEYHCKPAEDPRWVGWLVGKEHFVRVWGVTDRDRPHHYSGEKLKRLLWTFDRLPFVEALSFHGDFTDDDLVHLKHMDRLLMVEFVDAPIEGHGLRHLAGAANLWDACFPGCGSFGDRGLEQLKHHKKLKWLELQGTQVTDEGLRALKELPRLERLRLNDTAITDAGLRHLAALHQIERLFLDGTGITDAGLAHLKGLRSLRFLSLSNTAITGSGLVHLRQIPPRLILSLTATQVSDANAEAFLDLPARSRIEIAFTPLSVDSMREIEARRSDLVLSVGKELALVAQMRIDQAKRKLRDRMRAREQGGVAFQMRTDQTSEQGYGTAQPIELDVHGVPCTRFSFHPKLGRFLPWESPQGKND